MKRFLIVLVACLGLAAGAPAEEKAAPAKQEPPKVAAKAEPPKPEPKKEVAAPAKAASPKAAAAKPRPVRRAPVRSEHATPHMETAARRPPVVWQRNQATPITVEWEDAPVRKPSFVEAKQSPPDVAEELRAILKSLEQLTELVRSLAVRPASD